MTAYAQSLGDAPDVRGLAHEFANLMQVVNGNLELLDTRVDDETARRYLANARAAAEQLTELSRRLSTAARRE